MDSVNQMKRKIVRVAETQEDFFRLIRVREEVFVVEQGISVEIELDDDDDRAIHFVAEAGGEIVGAARLVVNGRTGKIGRMAVRKKWRRSGIGADLISFIKLFAKRRRLSQLYLHAQETAIPFYERTGFLGVGRRFKEAGIPHRKMIYEIKPTPAASARPRSARVRRPG
jgi:predicted GNAT family N-acyltransferase